MKRRKLYQSFTSAFEGVIFAFRSERNMGLHIIAAAVAIAASFYFHLGTAEFLAVLSAIFFVFITEMINTAVEAAVDLKTKKIHPLARVAKNVAAGAVLLAAVYALLVAILVFSGPVGEIF